jgi:predicted phosphodiesterase
LLFLEIKPTVANLLPQEVFVSLTLTKLLVGSDIHWPYEDKRAYGLFIKTIDIWKPDILVLNGDILDCFTISEHDKDPRRVITLDTEIAYANARLDALDAYGIKRKIFIEGNHCFRLSRYLMRRAPELFNTVKIEKLLKLKERGWEHVAYKDYVKIGKLYITHDVGKAGGSAHSDARNTFDGNVLIGHTHRMAFEVKGNIKNKPHFGAMAGWLGDAKQCDYMHKAKAAKDWTLGFFAAYIDDRGAVFPQLCPIVNYSTVLGGQLIRG